MESGKRKDTGGLSENLREAVERTFAATAETRERAQGLLDEVSRRGREVGETVAQRGQEAREAITQRGQEAQEASAGVAARVVEAIEGMRLATRDDLLGLERQVEELSKRVSVLESRRPDSKVEG